MDRNDEIFSEIAARYMEKNSSNNIKITPTNHLYKWFAIGLLLILNCWNNMIPFYIGCILYVIGTMAVLYSTACMKNSNKGMRAAFYISIVTFVDTQIKFVIYLGFSSVCPTEFRVILNVIELVLIGCLLLAFFYGLRDTSAKKPLKRVFILYILLIALGLSYNYIFAYSNYAFIITAAYITAYVFFIINIFLSASRLKKDGYEITCSDMKSKKIVRLIIGVLIVCNAVLIPCMVKISKNRAVDLAVGNRIAYETEASNQSGEYMECRQKMIDCGYPEDLVDNLEVKEVLRYKTLININMNKDTLKFADGGELNVFVIYGQLKEDEYRRLIYMEWIKLPDNQYEDLVYLSSKDIIADQEKNMMICVDENGDYYLSDKDSGVSEIQFFTLTDSYDTMYVCSGSKIMYTARNIYTESDYGVLNLRYYHRIGIGSFPYADSDEAAKDIWQNDEYEIKNNLYDIELTN